MRGKQEDAGILMMLVSSLLFGNRARRFLFISFVLKNESTNRKYLTFNKNGVCFAKFSIADLEFTKDTCTFAPSKMYDYSILWHL